VKKHPPSNSAKLIQNLTTQKVAQTQQQVFDAATSGSESSAPFACAMVDQSFLGIIEAKITPLGLVLKE